MANSKQQEKRNRQNEKRRMKNAQIKSSVRTAKKKLLKAITSSNAQNVSDLNQMYHNFQETIDSAVQKGVYKKNTGSRYKSNIMKRINAVAVSSQE